MPETVHRIVYASAASQLFSRDDINALLNDSRRRNAARGISGLLLYHDGSLLQVLEGPPETVLPLYETIRRDPRHRQIITLWSGLVEGRAFGRWRMGFVDAETLDDDLRHDAVALEQLMRNPQVDDAIVEKLIASFLNPHSPSRSLILLS